MKKKTRLVILLACVICFFAISPILVAYSMGYRYDFENKKIVSTGGIYVRTFPSAEQVLVDSKFSVKPGVFSGAVFTQSLLPKTHTILVQKLGYYDYFKAIPVKEREVTKLENVTLFKKDISFDVLLQNIGYFSIAPNNQNIITSKTSGKIITLDYFSLNNGSAPQEIETNQPGKVLDIQWHENSRLAIIKIQNAGEISYYLFNASAQPISAELLPYLDKNSRQIFFSPQNIQDIFYEEGNALYLLKDNVPKAVIKGLLAYQFSGQNIMWLGQDGLLKLSNISGKLIQNISEEKLKINLSENYEIININGKTFLKTGSSILLLNRNAKSFEKFDAPDGDYKLLASGDNRNLILWNANNIYVYSFDKEKYGKLFSGEGVTSCQWLNNDYIIFTSQDKIIISEIDYVGNINSVTLPKTFENPETLFNSRDGKVYILSSGVLTASEKLTP